MDYSSIYELFDQVIAMIWSSRTAEATRRSSQMFITRVPRYVHMVEKSWTHMVKIFESEAAKRPPANTATFTDDYRLAII